MKVGLLTPNEDWICDKMAKQFCDYTSHTSFILGQTDQGVDGLWITAPWVWWRVGEESLHTTPVVCTIHHIVPDKLNLADFQERDKFVDAYHVPCEQTKNNIKEYTDKPIHVLGYWIDQRIWYPEDREESKKKLNLDNGKLIIGSLQRDTEGSDEVSPKLEKGPDIFCDYMEKLNKDYPIHVLLGGWRRQYVVNRLNKANIPFTYMELPPQDIIRTMYCACDLYVVPSRYEGGPQSLLECARTNTPIISTDVGMARELLSEKCVVNLSEDVYFPTEEDVKQNYITSEKHVLETKVKLYDSLLEDVFNAYRNK